MKKFKTVLESECKKFSNNNYFTYSLHILAISSWPSAWKHLVLPQEYQWVKLVITRIYISRRISTFIYVWIFIKIKLLKSNYLKWHYTEPRSILCDPLHKIAIKVNFLLQNNFLKVNQVEQIDHYNLVILTLTIFQKSSIK